MEENKLFVKLNIQRFASHLQTWGTYYRVSGTGSPSTRAGFDANGQIAVYLESQDTANNTSRIRIDHKIKIYRHSSATSYDSVFVENTSSYRANQGSQGGSYQSKTGTGGYNGNGTSSERVINLGSTYHTVYHNSDGTGRLYVNGSASLYVYIIYKDGNSTYAKTPMNSSFNVALPTIPRYANITSYSVVNNGLNSIRVTWNTDATCDSSQYSLNGGAWQNAPAWKDFTIGNLNPGTQYSVKIRVRRQDSQLWKESSVKYATTTDIAKITSAIDFNDSQKPKFNFTNPSGSRVDVFIGYSDGIGIWKNNIPNTGSYEFNLTQAEWDVLYAKNYNFSHFTIKYTIKTVAGSGWEHSVIKNMTIINANPTFSSFEYEDTGGDTLIPEVKTTDLTGNNQTIIKGYSNLRARITSANKMVAVKGATPKEYQLVVGSKQIKKDYHETNDVDLTLDAIENNVFIVYAIDSRNNSTQKQISPTEYIDYFRPVLNDLVINRENNISTFVNLSFTGTFLNVDFGAEINEITAKYQYRNTKSDEWIIGDTDLTLDISDNNFSFNNSIAGDLDAEGFSISESFEIKIIVEDLLSNNEKSEILVSAKPNLALHQDGVGVNQPFDELLGSGLQITGNKIMFNGITLFEWVDE